MIFVLIVALFLVVLTLAQLFILGYKGGIGPLKFLKNQKMAKLPGNAEQYHLENVEPLADSPLKGKTICFLGSSVTNGSASICVAVCAVHTNAKPSWTACNTALS